MSLYLGNIKIPNVEINQIKPPTIIYSTEQINHEDPSPYPEGTIYIVIEEEQGE